MSGVLFGSLLLPLVNIILNRIQGRLLPFCIEIGAEELFHRRPIHPLIDPSLSLSLPCFLSLIAPLTLLCCPDLLCHPILNLVYRSTAVVNFYPYNLRVRSFVSCSTTHTVYDLDPFFSVSVS